MFISSLDIRYTDELPIMFQEIEQLHDAVHAGDVELAQKLWSEKFERCMRDIVDRLPDEEVDGELWVKLHTARRAGELVAPQPSAAGGGRACSVLLENFAWS